MREDRNKDTAYPRKERVVLGNLSPNKPTGTERTLNDHSGKDENAADLAKRCKKAEAQFQKVSEEYQSIRDKYEDAKRLVEEHRNKLRMRNDTIATWEDFAKRQAQTIKKLCAQLKKQGHHPEAVEDIAGGDVTGSIPLPRAHNSNSSADDGQPFSPYLPSVPHLDVGAAHKSPKRIVSEPPPSIIFENAFEWSPRQTASFSDVAVGGDVPLPVLPDNPVQTPLKAIKQEPSSDGLEFVSARPVRKRKHARDEPDSLTRTKIKLEHSSSSSGVEVVNETHPSSQAESIDFEEEVHVPTPRKHRALQEARRERAETEAFESLRPRLSNSLQAEPVQADMTPRMFSKPTSKAILSSKAQQQWLSGTTSAHTRSLGMPLARKSTGPGLASTFNLEVKDLEEDGESESVELQSPLIRDKRFGATLNTPSAPASVRSLPPRGFHSPASPFVRSSGVGRSLPPSYEPSSTRKVMAKTPSTRPMPPPSQPSVVRNRGPKRPSILRDDMPRGRTTTRDEKPLRERAEETLRPEDFKPNPAYNDGLDYVYDEVVRGKDARAALQGCIDPNCCGKTFRNFAEQERDTVGPVLTSRAEDIGLMEKYLGGEAWKLGMMTREQKEETWLVAKTWDLANKFGKHRQRYSRMPTPPGYWSMDFPNTQERAEEHRQAEGIRRELVAQRYREAMRKGGAWLFRDE